MKISHIAYSLSGLLLILGGSFLLPIAFSLYFQDGLHTLFSVQMGAMLVLGLALRHFIPGPDHLSLREGFLIVSLSWVFMSFLGAVPFILSGFIPSLTDAFFETMSGFTTTGASILKDIEALPKSLLVWRSMTHWLGGMGVIALAVAIFPSLGVGAGQLFKAEAPGPIKEKISPRISETAKILWMVYLLFTAAETLLLMIGGLDLFESLCTTFGTLATGGFSPRNASIGAYPSLYIQYVVILFMFVSGANFNLHYFFLKGRWTAYGRDSEFRFYCGVTVLALGLVVLIRLMGGWVFSEELFRSSLFHTVSILTTTGFITVDYEYWPLATRIILLFLMFIGGCTSSTGGAIKNIRIQVLLKQIVSEIKKLFHPHGVFPIKIGNKPIPDTTVSNIMGFFILYVLLFSLSVLAMAWFGLELDTSIGAVAATLGNVGPGIGTVGPAGNYAHIPILGKWILSFLMMAGRLEVYTVLVIFLPRFWR
ncbi:MAG: potassium transporter [Deltaproteobacteria bacterium RBG_16_48_10]|nr:MAG: potassium transporter [Deltaproteobacteria bacterium RBG_16_48_10]